MQSPAWKHIFLVILLGLLIVGQGCKERRTVVSGKVAVAGHEPFTYVRIIDADKIEYKLVGPKEKLLREKYQGRRVRVVGKVVAKAKGPGFPAELLVEKILED